MLLGSICSQLSRLFFIVLGISLALTTSKAKNIAIALAITFVRTSWRANPVPICDVICECLLYDCNTVENYMFLRDVSVWIVIWGSSHELYVCTVFLNKCMVEQPDTIQHNGITNSKMEICACENKFVLLQVIGNSFPWRWEEYHIKSEVIKQFFVEKLSND